MGRITSRGCARNYWITLDFVSCDPIVPGTANHRDRTHQIKLLSNNVFISRQPNQGESQGSNLTTDLLHSESSDKLSPFHSVTSLKCVANPPVFI